MKPLDESEQKSGLLLGSRDLDAMIAKKADGTDGDGDGDGTDGTDGDGTDLVPVSLGVLEPTGAW